MLSQLHEALLTACLSAQCVCLAGFIASQQCGYIDTGGERSQIEIATDLLKSGIGGVRIIGLNSASQGTDGGAQVGRTVDSRALRICIACLIRRAGTVKLLLQCGEGRLGRAATLGIQYGLFLIGNGRCIIFEGLLHDQQASHLLAKRLSEFRRQILQGTEILLQAKQLILQLALLV
ncbi:hypothetical protein D9M69_475940 [compost metagenome]